ncbi:MAG: aquaporin [Pirellulaceae bacterium]|nr:aquaporin [Pirellulaceae bacterium]
MNAPQPTLRDCVIAEILGTFVLIFFGCGAVHAAVLFGAQAGLWQVAIVWGVAIMLAAYAFGGISGAHINPAITVAMYCWNRFPGERVLPYIGAQLLGAFLAAAALYAIFSPKLAAVESIKQVVRGQPGSEITACCYGEFFPAPGGLAAGTTPYRADEHAELRKTVTHSGAFFAELLGTSILAVMVLAMTDLRNQGGPGAKTAPIFIGLTVSLLISVIAPVTQACFNPARDFAPRLFSSLAGWGQIALPLGSDWSWLTVYIVAPTLGAVLGGGFYTRVIKPMYGVGDL